MSRPASVFLLAENRLLREALVRLLNKKIEFCIVGSSGYEPDICDRIQLSQVDVVLTDSNALASAHASLIPSILRADQTVRVIMVDMDSDESTFLQAVRMGVVGYVLKDASAAEVASAIRAVVAGEAVCPPVLSVALFRSLAQPEPSFSISLAEDMGLSRREQQLVELLSARLTNKEIAGRLNLSEQTVKNHVHHILRKTGVNNRSDVVTKCMLDHTRRAET